jgi:hypothetical protein
MKKQYLHQLHQLHQESGMRKVERKSYELECMIIHLGCMFMHF